MGEKFTSRVGYLIRNFRIASDMTQKELADKCGLNESTIRNYELGNRYPDEATLLNIANHLGVSFYALSDPDVANIFSALHVLFDIEWAYGLRPTMKDGEVCFKFEERLPSAGPRPQEDLNNFRKMVEYWASLRDKLEDDEISETEYYLKEVKYPMNPTDCRRCSPSMRSAPVILSRSVSAWPKQMRRRSKSVCLPCSIPASSRGRFPSFSLGSPASGSMRLDEFPWMYIRRYSNEKILQYNRTGTRCSGSCVQGGAHAHPVQ